MPTRSVRGRASCFLVLCLVHIARRAWLLEGSDDGGHVVGPVATSVGGVEDPPDCDAAGRREDLTSSRRRSSDRCLLHHVLPRRRMGERSTSDHVFSFTCLWMVSTGASVMASRKSARGRRPRLLAERDGLAGGRAADRGRPRRRRWSAPAAVVSSVAAPLAARCCRRWRSSSPPTRRIERLLVLNTERVSASGSVGRLGAQHIHDQHVPPSRWSVIPRTWVAAATPTVEVWSQTPSVPCRSPSAITSRIRLAVEQVQQHRSASATAASMQLLPTVAPASSAMFVRVLPGANRCGHLVPRVRQGPGQAPSPSSRSLVRSPA